MPASVLLMLTLFLAPTIAVPVRCMVLTGMCGSGFMPGVGGSERVESVCCWGGLP